MILLYCTCSDAAPSIGALSSCEEGQLLAYATLAKAAQAFGSDVHAWSEADITAIGAVLGERMKLQRIVIDFFHSTMQAASPKLK